MPALYNITLISGEPIERTVELLQDDTGLTPVDLTGFTFTSQISSTDGFADNLGTFEILINIPAATIRLRLTEEQTAAMPYNACYRIRWQAVGNLPEILLYGRFTIAMRNPG